MFCRVRPLLPDDGVGTDSSVVAYPSSVESLGRGIDLVQSGMNILVLFVINFNQFNCIGELSIYFFSVNASCL